MLGSREKLHEVLIVWAQRVEVEVRAAQEVKGQAENKAWRFT